MPQSARSDNAASSSRTPPLLPRPRLDGVLSQTRRPGAACDPRNAARGHKRSIRDRNRSGGSRDFAVHLHNSGEHAHSTPQAHSHAARNRQHRSTRRACRSASCDPGRHWRLHPLRAPQGPQQDCLRRRQPHRAADVCGRRGREPMKTRGACLSWARAGQLLNNMIGAMGLKREEVYIANVVKCRPPGNRTPRAGRGQHPRSSCSARSMWFGPQVLVALGATAATYLLASASRWPVCGVEYMHSAARSLS